jgi:hypothetical protein
LVEKVVSVAIRLAETGAGSGGLLGRVQPGTVLAETVGVQGGRLVEAALARVLRRPGALEIGAGLSPARLPHSPCSFSVARSALGSGPGSSSPPARLRSRSRSGGFCFPASQSNPNRIGQDQIGRAPPHSPADGCRDRSGRRFLMQGGRGMW